MTRDRLRRYVVMMALAVACSTSIASGQRGSVPAGPADPSTGAAAIAGRVVDSQTGAPIARATVRIQSLGTPVSAPALPPFAITTVTDARGEFSARDLPNWSLSISAQAAGYVYGSYTTSVRLNGGETLSGITIRLAALGVISGAVRDGAGAPLGRVNVQLFRVSPGLDARSFVPESTLALTNTNGEYRAVDVQPGQYVVAAIVTPTTTPTSVVQAYGLAKARSGFGAELLQTLYDSRAPLLNGVGETIGPEIFVFASGSAGRLDRPAIGGPDHRPLTYRTTFHGGAADLTDAAVVDVTAGARVANVDIDLSPAPGFAVSGALTGSGGPAAFVGVRLMAETAASFGIATPARDDALTVTDIAGRFRFLSVPEGRYTLLACLASAPPAGPPPVELVNSWARTDVVVRATDVAIEPLAMREPVSFSGTVATTTGDAPPVLATPLSVNWVRRGPAFSAPLGSARVSVLGTFRGAFGLPGLFDLSVSLQAAWSISSIQAEGQDITHGVLRAVDHDVTNIRVVLTNRPAQLTVRARDRAGAPVRTPQIVIFPADYQHWAPLSGRVLKTLRTPSDAYTVGQLPPGDYLAAAFTNSSWTDSADPQRRPEPVDRKLMDALAPTATRVTVAEGTSQTVDVLTVAR